MSYKDREKKNQYQREWQRKWIEKNPDKHREHMKEYSKNYYRKIRKEVISHYGDKCICCGETTFEFLTIDHMDGDGNKHRIKVSTSALPRWLKKNTYPPNFQILCYNCNNSKGIYGICPHKKI